MQERKEIRAKIRIKDPNLTQQKGEEESMKEGQKEQPQRQENDQHTVLLKDPQEEKISKKEWPEISAAADNSYIMKSDYCQ